MNLVDLEVCAALRAWRARAWCSECCSRRLAPRRRPPALRAAPAEVPPPAGTRPGAAAPTGHAPPTRPRRRPSLLPSSPRAAAVTAPMARRPIRRSRTSLPAPDPARTSRREYGKARATCLRSRARRSPTPRSSERTTTSRRVAPGPCPRARGPTARRPRTSAAPARASRIRRSSPTPLLLWSR